MSFTGKIAKAAAYAKMPRRTFMLLHPIRAAKLGAAYLVGRRLFRRNRDAGRDGHGPS